MVEDIQQLKIEYYHLLEKMKPAPSEKDYQRFNLQIPLLEEISRIESSAISVFDMYKKIHLYTSYNFSTLFGKNIPQPISTEYFNTRIHPDDLKDLMKAGIEMLKYCISLKREERQFIKLINEFRIKTQGNNWIKVIEQHKILEQDTNGDVWLSISTLDISPDQNLKRSTLSRVVNLKTHDSFLINDGKGIDQARLTKRESQILSLIDKGLLSKEIGNQLNISIHTVNTHRQRILEKTNSSNAIEALNYGKRVGIID